jgi:hypothetical protein
MVGALTRLGFLWDNREPIVDTDQFRFFDGNGSIVMGNDKCQMDRDASQLTADMCAATTHRTVGDVPDDPVHCLHWISLVQEMPHWLCARESTVVACSTNAATTTTTSLESSTASSTITLSVSVIHHSLLYLLFVRLVRWVCCSSL